MQTRSHDRYSYLWFPNVDKQKLRDVNRAIDNPRNVSNRVQRQVQQKTSTGGYWNPFDILQLGRHSGHRQVGHDALSSMFIGYQIAGLDGARAGLLHTFLDGVRDNWKRQFGGAKAADLIEAALNFNAL